MINSVARALHLIDVLVEMAPGASLGDLAEAAGMPRPTTYRILQTLVHHGYAAGLANGVYQPGPAILTLAGRLLASMDSARYARPALLELQSWTQETIHFGVLIGDEAQYVDKIESRRPYRLASVVGMRLALHCTAIGKAMLAFLPDERVERLLTPDRLGPRTANTITDQDTLRAHLAEIRERGYSLDDEEDNEGVRCIGAPVFDHRGQVVGAISVSGPTFHFTREQAEALAVPVMKAARSTSMSLGASPEDLPAIVRGLELEPSPVT